MEPEPDCIVGVCMIDCVLRLLLDAAEVELRLRSDAVTVSEGDLVKESEV